MKNKNMSAFPPITSANIGKPLGVVECDRMMLLDWQVQFCMYFLISNAECLNTLTPTQLKRAVLNDSKSFKRGASSDLPNPICSQKYTGPVPLKENKSCDIAKIVDKYIQAKFKDCYQNILSASTPTLSDTDKLLNFSECMLIS